MFSHFLILDTSILDLTNQARLRRLCKSDNLTRQTDTVSDPSHPLPLPDFDECTDAHATDKKKINGVRIVL